MSPAGDTRDGPNLVAAHPAPNENAWLLGQAAMREGSLVMSEDVGLAGAGVSEFRT